MEWNKVQHRQSAAGGKGEDYFMQNCVLFYIWIYQGVMWPVVDKQVSRMLLWEVWGVPPPPPLSR